MGRTKLPRRTHPTLPSSVPVLPVDHHLIQERERHRSGSARVLTRVASRLLGALRARVGHVPKELGGVAL